MGCRNCCPGNLFCTLCTSPVPIHRRTTRTDSAANHTRRYAPQVGTSCIYSSQWRLWSCNNPEGTHRSHSAGIERSPYQASLTGRKQYICSAHSRCRSFLCTECIVLVPVSRTKDSLRPSNYCKASKVSSAGDLTKMLRSCSTSRSLDRSS
jgi:hypothetical protein